VLRVEPEKRVFDDALRPNSVPDLTKRIVWNLQVARRVAKHIRAIEKASRT